LSVYADSSFFVSLYMDDAHSLEAQRRMATHPQIWLLPLNRVEWVHSIAQHVFRREISLSEAAQFYSAFEADRRLGLYLEREMAESAFETAIELGQKYVPRLGTRTLDTLHIASALALAADAFWTFDDRQAKLARAVGLKTS
jgi:predicted nucleic acid-binding protein